MDTKAINDEVQSAVNQYMKTKEDAAKLELTEKFVGEASATIQELTNTVLEKEAEIADALEQNVELQAKLDEVTALVEQLQKDVDNSNKAADDLKARAEDAETQLADIMRARLTDQRMKELESAKVAKTGAKLEEQRSRVSEMGDEEFVAYKQDLVDFRASVEEQLRAETAAAAEESEVETVPADIDPKNTEVAAVNVETEITSVGEYYNKVMQALTEKMHPSK